MPEKSLQKIDPSDTESSRMLNMIERMATDPQCDPAKLREILSVKQNWEADEARKAFALDMANFQARCPIIEKADSANGKNYARIDRIHRQTRPLRTECGFWFIWNSAEIKGEIAYIDGILGHRGGHTVPCKQVIPLPDEIVSREGKKVGNAAQRAGSGMTYAKRYGECLALGIVTGEDDDGNRGRQERPSGPSSLAPKDLNVKELASRLWNLLKPVVSQDPNWVKTTWAGHNNFMWKNEILDGAIPESAPDLSAKRFEKAIADTIEKLKELQ